MKPPTSSEQPESLTLIQEHYCQSLAEVFSYYTSSAVPFDGVSPTQPELRMECHKWVASVLGFGDERLSGSSVLLVPHSGLTGLPGGEGLEPLDWLGELNNQIVGRLKNKLARLGLHTFMGTPMTISGCDLDIAPSSEAPAHYSARWANAEIHALLDIRFFVDLALPVTADVEVAEEGSLQLF